MSAETIPQLLREAARRWGEKTALKPMSGNSASFAWLDEQADRFAHALISDGMLLGERVGLWAPNSREWVAAAVGAQRAGGTLVPLNTRLRMAEASDMLARARVSRIVTVGTSYDLDYPALLRGQGLPDLRRVIVLPPTASALEGVEVDWEQFLALGEGLDAARLREREAGVAGDTISDILFTSGTTGRPKGAMFTHRSSVLSGHGMVNFARVGEQDCLCPLGPFSHFAGYKGGWVNGLVTGAAVTWTEAHDPASILDAIQRMGVTVMPAPPVVWQDVLDHPARADWDISSLRFIATGSSMIPPVLITRLVAELGVEQVGTGYGLTESGGMTNFSRREDPAENVAFTAGRPAPDAEVRIADPAGKELAAGETGEILVRTSRALCEYLDDAEATREALDAEGWLHTGDVGHVDSEGYLTVTDRLKEMYITNGYNVYPAELEVLISAMPGVSHCAVVGVDDARKGETGHAFLIRADASTISEAQAIAWCRENIASYKVPAGVTFVDTLPRNTQGKVLKQELKKLLG
ncbi:MAG: AMP-binding protein [Novosphingobium sp.]|nr:AMP-binding protein [Novosphingobium sp.]